MLVCLFFAVFILVPAEIETQTVGFAFDVKDDALDLLYDGQIWLRTHTEWNPERREETYKVYTSVFDFDGVNPITKGAGGLFTHHRGLFIGWSKTGLSGEIVSGSVDTWHMPDCRQEHVRWDVLDAESDHAVQENIIEWKDDEGHVFIREQRKIVSRQNGQDTRIFDFYSTLTAVDASIQLRGDSHHAGMQVRFADEVSQHEDTTEYILPEEAIIRPNDEVEGAWWACCSAVVNDTRYWMLHMTPEDHPTGVPVYSIRKYARFGAFFEDDIPENTSTSYKFRIVLSSHALDQNDCQTMYTAWMVELNDEKGE